MALTVRQILDLEVVQSALPEVIAGEKGLDQRVRWVHISDYVDIANSLHGGELLLTSGKNLGDDPRVQDGFLEDMSGAGVAAVMLEAGEMFREVPRNMIATAERLGLAFILLRRPTPYVDITQRVHTSLINSSYEAMQESQRIQEDLTELVLAGARPRQLVGRLAQTFRNPVFLEDPAHHLIEYAGFREKGDAVAAAWARHSRSGHEESPSEEVYSEGETRRCAWSQINALGQTWGRLHVLEVDTEFGEMTPLLINLGAATVGLSLVADRQASDWVEQARSSLVDDILRGSYESEEQLVRRGLQLGVRLDSEELMALVVQVTGPAAEPSRQLDGRDPVLAGLVRSVLAESKATAISTSQGERVLVIGAPPVLSSTKIGDLVRSLAEKIVSRVGPATGGRQVVIGTCVDASASSLRRTIDRATLALSCGLIGSTESGVYDFSELGFEEILFRLSEGPELSLLIEAEIGPLLAHDSTDRGDLTETLRVVLSSPSVSSAARTLHIERRSLYHRIEKIKEILGRDLNDPATHVRLTMALEAHAFVKRREELAAQKLLS